MSVDRQVRIMAVCLFFFAGWTLVIKFIVPLVWAFVQGEPPLTHVWWDAWWMGHLLVGAALLRPAKYAWEYALGLAAVEVAIIVTKFAIYLPDPTMDLWHINWFVNKFAMLVYFLYTLAWLFKASTRTHFTHEKGGPRPPDAV